MYDFAVHLFTYSASGFLLGHLVTIVLVSGIKFQQRHLDAKSGEREQHRDSGERAEPAKFQLQHANDDDDDEHEQCEIDGIRLFIGCRKCGGRCSVTILSAKFF